jgi:putative restriction endonuclease
MKFEVRKRQLKTLEFYIKAFQNLRRAPNLGGAPHKPVLLLALLKAFELGIYNSNRIYITPELISFFKTFWSALVKTGHKESFVLPFYHLQGERSKFWKLVAKPGYLFALTSSNSIKSFKALTDALAYAEIDIELAELLKDRMVRNILMEAILSQYFPENSLSRVEKLKSDYYKEIQEQLFNEPNPEYITKVKQIYSDFKDRDEETEIETYTRSVAFKEVIPKIYNYSCAITGMRIDGTVNVSMIDACHIIPFSESYDDTITNGIALCPNMHRAFDRGLISISDNYKVIVSDCFVEKFSHYSIKQYEGKEILMPKQNEYWPSQNSLKWHREKNNF